MANAQSLEYGFVQDAGTPTRITATATPDFTSAGNATLSTAVFTFLLPPGTTISPDIALIPSQTGLGANNITGVWSGQKITPALIPALTVDVFQVVLQNQPSFTAAPGVPVDLFFFDLPADCSGGTVEILTNDDATQQAIFMAAGANVNNQMSYDPDGSGGPTPATDIYSGNDAATFSLTCPLIAGPNNPPVAGDAAITVAEESVDTPLGLAAPTDADMDPLTISVTTLPTLGTVTLADGTPVTVGQTLTEAELLGLQYDAPADYDGVADPGDFVYTVDDGTDTDTGTVDITITPVNDPPVAGDDNASTAEDTPVTIPLATLTANDSDPDGDTLAITPATGTSTNGTFTCDATGCTYTPNPGFSGTDTFTYEVCDPGMLCATATVTVSIGAVNDPPVAGDDAVSTNEDTPVTTDAATLLGNDNDPDADMLAITPASGTTPNGSYACSATGCTYTPNPEFSGTDTYPYEVCDPSGLCDTAIVTVTINPVDDPPVTGPDNVVGQPGVPVTIDVLGNDSDDSALVPTSVMLLDPVSGTPTTTVTIDGEGTYSVNPDGTVTFTPEPTFTGISTIDYQVADDTGNVAPGTITVSIAPLVIPTLQEWGMLLMMLLLAAFGWHQVRRERRSL